MAGAIWPSNLYFSFASSACAAAGARTLAPEIM
jgi:hypothetical protein